MTRREEVAEFIYLNSHMTREEAYKFAIECLSKELTKEQIVELIKAND